MPDRLNRLVSALSPVMNRVQAEGFLHLTALTCHKRPENLTYDDWPAIERTIREALHGTPSESRADAICERLHEAFLADADGSDC